MVLTMAERSSSVSTCKDSFNIFFTSEGRKDSLESLGVRTLMSSWMSCSYWRISRNWNTLSLTSCLYVPGVSAQLLSSPIRLRSFCLLKGSICPPTVS